MTSPSRAAERVLLRRTTRRGDASTRALAWAAAAVLLAGIVVRLAPIGLWALWGSDTGEYYFLTERLLESSRISFAYDGWGIAYPYFPAMFVLTGAVVATTGIDLLTALEATVPAVAGLLGLGVLLVTHRATGSALAAVVAGAFAAVTAPNVIVTSHAMPGSLGHVLLIAGLYLVLAAREDARFGILLVPLVPALVVTHHLSTYFFVGIVAAAAFFREMGSARWDRDALRVEVPVVVGSLAVALAWWLGVATPFRERIVGDAFDLSPVLTTAIFAGALLAAPAAVLAKRRAFAAWNWRPRVWRVERAALASAAFVAAFVGLIVLFIYTGVPGTNIRVTWLTLAWVLPAIPYLVLALVGAGAARFTRDAHFLAAWAGAILASLALASVTGNRVLFPYRHVDYMVEALAALAGIGFLVVAAYAERARASNATRGLFVALAVVLVVSTIMSYPPRETVGGFEEAMTAEELAAVRWAGDHLPADATIAADHRVSSLLFGFAGLRATWDYTPDTYHAESWEPVFDELRALDIPSGQGVRIDYVFLSPTIREGVTLVQWENSRPMTDAAWEKFFADTTHFEHVYGEDDVHVFRVRWENA